MKSLVLLILIVVSIAACSPKRDSAGASAPPAKAAEKSEAGGVSILNPKATLDDVQKRLDAAAAKDEQRRQQIELQTK